MRKTFIGNFTMLSNSLIADKNLDAFEFRVFAYLMSRSNNENFCFPSYKTIESDLQISHSKVINAVKKLKELGYIQVEVRRFGNDRQTSNGYTILKFPNRSVSKTQIGVSEKPLPGVPEIQGSISDVPEQNTNNNIKYIFNNNQPTTDEVVDKAELYNLHLQEDRDLFETSIRKMYLAKSITVNGEVIPQALVRNALQRIDYEITAQAWDALKFNNVANKMPYLMSTLYNLLTEKSMTEGVQAVDF